MEKKDNTAKKKGGKLVKTIRFGAVAANIWERQTQTGFPYFEYSLSRSWKSTSSGKEGYSSNFHGRNMTALTSCIEGATQWIEDNTATEVEDVPFVPENSVEGNNAHAA